MRVSLNEESQSTWQGNNLEYLRYDYDLKPDDIVIDVGAYRGEWAQQIVDKFSCRVIAIEPTDNIYRDGFGGEIVNKAAWLFDGRIKFGGAFYYTSSYEDPTHEYECFDIVPFLSQLERIALLKMNVEGSEYSILEHLYQANLLKRIEQLQIQFHLIEGQNSELMYAGTSENLSKTHKPKWCYPFCWESWVKK